VNTLEQNGFQIGRLTDVDIDEYGVINLEFSNGMSRDIGQILLAKFESTDCLSNVESSDSLEITESCSTTLGFAGEEGFGLLDVSIFEE